MATLDALSSTKATMSENLSVGLVQEIFDQSSWRLYISTVHFGVETLITRFLSTHALMPGVVSETLYASVSVATFRYTDREGALFEGYLFLNGAVIRIIDGERTIYCLYVDASTASMWGYPPNFLSYKDRHPSTEKREVSGKQVDTPEV